jgi:hypothetical protein
MIPPLDVEVNSAQSVMCSSGMLPKLSDLYILFLLTSRRIQQ